MKRIISLCLALTLLAVVFCLPANAASVYLSGPSSAESGSTVTFSVQASAGEGLTGLSATIIPDSGLVVKSVSGCPAGWLSASNTNAISIAGTSAVSSVSITITCEVTGNPGDSRTLTLSNVKTSDPNGNDAAAGGSSKTISVAAPKSGENRLASLSASGYSISFNENTTTYDIGKVPFDVKSISINAKAKDPEASVKIAGNGLVVGQNTITVTVTAPNGSAKQYYIKVVREQDPNYKPGSDGTLSELSISNGTMSPVFDSKIKEYVVYLPYEVETFSAEGKAAAEKALGVKNIEEAKLKVGTNELSVVCTAEDESKTEYKLYVVRMDQFGGKDTVGVPASLLDKVAEPEAKDEEPVEVKQGVSPVVLAIAAVACLLLGFAIGAVVFRKKDKAVEPELEDEVLAEAPETSEDATPFKVDDNYLKYFEDPDKKE